MTTTITDRNRIIETHYRENYKKLVGYAYKMLGDRADDAVQEAYTRSMEIWDINPPSNVEEYDALLRRLLPGTMMKEYRDSRNFLGDEDSASDDVGRPGNQETMRHLASMIEKIDDLQPRYKKAFKAHLIYGHSMKNVCTAYDLPYGSMREMLKRFRKKLK